MDISFKNEKVFCLISPAKEKEKNKKITMIKFP